MKLRLRDISSKIAILLLALVLWALPAMAMEPASQLPTHRESGIFFENTAVQNPTSISGVVRIPPNFNLQGAQIGIGAQGHSHSHWVFITVPEGATEVAYTLQVDRDRGPYRMLYHFGTTEIPAGLLRSGWHAPTGTQLDSRFASLLSVAAEGLAGIDFDLLVGAVVRGQVALPGEDVAPAGGMSIILQGGGQSAIANIAQGERAVQYTLTVPIGIPFTVEYVLNSPSGEPYARRGFYHPNGTVWFSRQAYSLTLDANGRDGVDLAILRGVRITGRLTLPVNAEPQGAQLWVTIQNDDSIWAQGSIAAGERGVAYELVVPANSSHVLMYNVWGASPLVVNFPTIGFFSASGPTGDHARATPVVVGEVDVSGVDIVLTLGTVVRGQLLLPAVLPSGFNLAVGATPGFLQHTIVPPGVSSSDFRFVVHAGSEFRIQYAIVDPVPAGFVQHAFYSLNGTTTSFQEATVFTANVLEIVVDIPLIAVQTETAIRGTVNLPDGHKAPDGGLTVTVITDTGHSTQVVIPAGQSQAQFTIRVPLGQHRVRYLYSGELDYVGQSWLGFFGMVPCSSQAAVFHVTPATPIADISLTLVPGFPVSGTVRLPEGQIAPPEGLRISIGSSTEGMANVTIPSGSSSAYYRVVLPLGAQIRVQYYIDEPSSETVTHSFLRQGYYTAGGTVPTWSAAQILIVNEPLTGIDLTLLEGTPITGTVSLPGNDVAPLGGFRVEISTQLGGTQSVVIPEGESSVPFRLVSPRGRVRVSYLLGTQGGRNVAYVWSGFYSAGGTTPHPEQATLIDVQLTPLTDINLTIVRGAVYSGTIKRPSNHVAPMSGLGVSVQLLTANSSWSIGLAILPGENAATFHFVIPLDVSPIVMYSLQSYQGTEYASEGFLAGTRMTTNRAEAIALAPGGAQGIVLTIIPVSTPQPPVPLPTGQHIRGTISLPVGEVAPVEGVVVLVGTDTGRHVLVTIPAGAREAAFTLAVPAGQHRVGYIYQGDGDYVTALWFAPSGMVAHSHQAAILNVAVNLDMSGLALTVVRGLSVSGTVSLPQGHVAPASGLHVHIQGFPGSFRNIVIPAGANSAPYRFAVLPGTHLRISYNLSHQDQHKYIQSGFFTAAGTVADSRAGQALVVNADLTGIDLTILEGTPINGTISLPDGDVAPAGGLRVFLSTTIGGSQSVAIPEGQSSVPFTLVAPRGLSLLSYFLSDNVAHLTTTYLLQGFYAVNGTTPHVSQATMLTIGEQPLTGINLTLLRGAVYSGLLSLPGNSVAPAGGLQVIVSAEGFSGQSVVIPQGASAVPYRLVVPMDVSPILMYMLQNQQGTAFITAGFLAGTRMTTNRAEAVPLPAGGATGIAMSIIPATAPLPPVPPMPGPHIRGTVSLPAGEVAPEGGIVVRVLTDTGPQVEVTIPAGASEVPFALAVPPGQYRIRYLYQGAGDFVTNMWLGVAGMVADMNQATVLNVAVAFDVSGVTLTLVRGLPISGTIRLPEGQVAPPEGLSIQVGGFPASWRNIVIPANSNFAPYRLIVPVGAQGVPSYFIFSPMVALNNYLRQGFYTATGTVSSRSAAQTLVVNAALTDIDFTILEGTPITGTVSLPDGDVAHIGGVSLGLSTDIGGWEWVTIPAGQASVPFRLVAPRGQARVSYSLSDAAHLANAYLRQGFFAVTGTTNNSAQATPLTIGTEPITDINLTVLRGAVYSGTISLPGNHVAPIGGLRMWVQVDQHGLFQELRIPTGASQAAFRLVIPTDIAPILMYSLPTDHGTGYAQSGFLAGTRMTTNRAEAIALAPGGATGINMALILVNPPVISVGRVVAAPGTNIVVPIQARHVHRFGGIQFVLNFDPTVLAVKTVTSNLPGAVLQMNFERALFGEIRVALATNVTQPASFTIGEVAFTVIATTKRVAPITISPIDGVLVKEQDGRDIWVEVVQGIVTVSPNFGDVNDDGVIDVGDAIQVLRAIVALREFSPRHVVAADVNGNGVVDVVDAILIMQRVVGNLLRFPVE